ncbi:MAG: SNF2-related protein, partial [Planctomycetota bacterium]
MNRSPNHRSGLRGADAGALSQRGVVDTPGTSALGFLEDMFPRQEKAFHRRWLDFTRNLYEMIPKIAFEEIRKERPRFDIDEIHSSGQIVGECHDAGERHMLLARLDEYQTPVVCTCEFSACKDVCIHGVGFMVYLLQQLEHADSDLSKSLINEDFATRPFDFHRFQVGDRQRILRRLKRSIDVEKSAWTVSDDSLPPKQERATGRMVWQLDGSNGEVEIRTLVQHPKKRGVGFTKARPLAPERLLHRGDVALNDRDRDVLNAARDQFGSVDYVHMLGGSRVCEMLVGSTNVQWMDRPLVIEPGTVRLCFRKQSADAFRILFRVHSMHPEREDPNFEAEPQQIWAEEDQPIIALVESEPAMVVAELPSGLSSIIHNLVQLDEVPTDEVAGLLEIMAPISRVITVEPPAEWIENESQSSVQPVLLARTHADGSLDFAIRVRDPNGVICKPGCGPELIHESTPEGKLSLVRRSLRCEIQVARGLAVALNETDLDPDATFESLRSSQSIPEIDGVLGFISRVHAVQSETPTQWRQRWASVASRSEVTVAPLEILWDESGGKPMTMIGSLSPNNVRVEIKRKRDWFGLSGSVQIGDQDLTLSSLLSRLQSLTQEDIQGDFIHLGDGKWAKIESDLRLRLQKLRDATHSDRKSLVLDATSTPLIREAFADSQMQLDAIKKWHASVERLEESESIDPELPIGLDATLRDYQLDGYRWLCRLAHWGVGGVLADDMGLGKTLQSLAVLLDRADQGPALIIAPTSVGFNWQREAERFTPDLNATLYRETDRGEFLRNVGPHDLVICSYGLALRDQELLASVPWHTCVLDEAQAIKNSNSKTSKAIFQIPSDWTIALTGTPVENHLGELWSLFHVVSPGVFGGWEDFRRRYAAPIERDDDPEAKCRLASRLKPFVLRRTKSAVLTELPPRTEQTLYVDLSANERATYDQMRTAALG